MITIFTIAYNEELMLPFFVLHYRKNFPDCRIVIYNNMSTDRTKDLAVSLGCEVIDYDTGGKLSDQTYLDIKNNCWKRIETEDGDRWVMIVDMDEFCEINDAQLSAESHAGVTVIDFIGYNMVNHANNFDITGITQGVRAPSYDKRYCFNAAKIFEINYLPGCHRANPRGLFITSLGQYRCLHYKYVQIDYMIKRHAHYASRLSDENIKKGWGFHYKFSPDAITEEFIQAQHNAIKIL